MSVWYSPKWNILREAKRDEGFIFKNEHGEFHLCYKYSNLKLANFYYIGEL